MKPILTFESTHAVLKAEKLLKEHGVPYEILPTPRHISSDCGMAIAVDRQVGSVALELLQNAKIHTKLHR